MVNCQLIMQHFAEKLVAHSPKRLYKQLGENNHLDDS